MFLFWYFLAGGVIGWTISKVIRLVRSASAQPNQRRLSPNAQFALAVVFLVLVVALAILVVIVASATDRAAVFTYLLSLKAFFTGVRVQCVLLAGIVGFFVEQQRENIDKAIRGLGRAVVGESEKSAWALQGAVAIGILAAIALILRPDLLQYLKSLKLGEFEATFADRAPTASLREAHLNLKDFREQVAFHQYEKFEQKFLFANNSRGWARALLQSPVQKQTSAITERLAPYVEPVIAALLCLNKAHAIRTATKDWELTAYAVVWEDFFLKLHADTKAAAEDKLQVFLAQLSLHANEFVGHVNSLAQECSAQAINPSRVETDAKVIASNYDAALPIMKKQQRDKPAVLAVVVFDSYFTGAVSDLIALISGDREKTDFLIKMTKDFPRSAELISPGIINLFYQTTDAWLNTAGPIAVADARTDIEFATTGANLMMSLSAARIPESEKEKTDAPGDCNAVDDKPLDHPDKMRGVYDTFLRNLFATLTAEADIFVQASLNGGEISEAERENWIDAVSHLAAMLQTRLHAPAMALDNVPVTSLDALMVKRLTKEKTFLCPQEDEAPSAEAKDAKTNSKPEQHALIDADFMLQANLAVALSAVLFSGEDRPSTMSCNTALFYTNSAVKYIEDTKTDNELDDAQQRRLEQLIAAVRAEIGQRCSWKPAEVKSASP
ncbi:hypothetical protein [Bradyrhizobium genosp. P]|uniref:hypothetical protein n=1 Tax=Bradyrhizobium genosp. P TaxID=83641 RepID=UPI003CF8FE5D